MNRIIILIIALIFLNQCSFKENSRIWKDIDNKLEDQKNIKKVFLDDKKITTEFNQELKLDLSVIKSNNKVTDNKNNHGSQNYEGLIDKISSYKFSKFEDTNQLNFKPIFLDDGLIFFDKKGSIIRYNDKTKVLWKQNHYSKLFSQCLSPRDSTYLYQVYKQANTLYPLF